MNSIHYSAIIYNRLKKLNFGLVLSDIYMNHLMAVFQTSSTSGTLAAETGESLFSNLSALSPTISESFY